VLSVVSITIGLMQATTGRQTEQILSELTQAHQAYAETRDLLGELEERAQAWVLLAGDPSERAQLERVQAQAKASLLHLRELTPDSLKPLLPPIDEIDAAIDAARVQLPTLSTEADLDLTSHAIDARLENVLKGVGRVYAKQVSGLEQQVKTLQDRRSRQTNDWFLCALVFLCASVWPVMRHLRQLGQEEGALRERGAILERISDGFIAVDAHWRYTYVNAAAERLLGHRREEMLGKSLWELSPSGEHDLRGDRYRRAMATQKPEIFERFVKDSNRWYETRVYPSPEGLSIYFRDVSEAGRKRG
jgi:PAS domain S-box-containing protein